jgi:hypothetical protein
MKEWTGAVWRSEHDCDCSGMADWAEQRLFVRCFVVGWPKWHVAAPPLRWLGDNAGRSDGLS